MWICEDCLKVKDNIASFPRRIIEKCGRCGEEKECIWVGW